MALVGGGGSGKSVLAAALGHRVARRFGDRIHWFRVGVWDYQTLLEIFALRFGTTRDRETRVEALRAYFVAHGPRLIVLDNHEDDRAIARLLDALSDTPVTFLITARRCLLAGVLVYPVTPPNVTTGRAPFPRVSGLTKTLRWNPLALDIADAIVASGEASADALRTYLEAEGVGRVRVIDHEDDLPEVALLVKWAWARLPVTSRRVLGALAHMEGDHVDGASIAKLARTTTKALGPLLRFRLVQEPLRGRYTLHAVVRYAVTRFTTGDPDRVFEHYLELLERDPRRLSTEQTNLFAAMDHAHRKNDLEGMLRIERLLERL